MVKRRTASAAVPPRPGVARRCCACWCPIWVFENRSEHGSDRRLAPRELSLRYNFLILCVLFAVPPLCIYGVRPDLRRPMAVTALFSLPFGLTESWFYPEYWQPEFLFDLADHIGFGVEDLLFVAALGAFTAT